MAFFIASPKTIFVNCEIINCCTTHIENLNFEEVMRKTLYLTSVLSHVALCTYLILAPNQQGSQKDEKEFIVKEKGVKQFDKPDLAIQQNNDMTMDPKLGYPPVERSLKAFEEGKRNFVRNRAVSETTWIERGPNNI